MDIKKGPTDPGAFPFRAIVNCDYLDKKLSGRSPKFACKIDPKDEVKVKFGGANGEVYAEVAATRLLWALGFGADRMYPVRIICHGCPAEFGGIERSNGDRIFDPAVIERKMPGEEFGAGWSWKELESIDEAAGGASRAQRDGLKLLAVFLQHTDSKPEQQRLACLDEPETEGPPACGRPFMMINDVGLTFGRANSFNANAIGSMNLAEWSRTPVWKDGKKCVGNLPRSSTGTLDNPAISEEGRQFLSSLLSQLSDTQIHDLFEVARVHLRLRKPSDPMSGLASIDEWVDAFKRKREEVANRVCD